METALASLLPELGRRTQVMGVLNVTPDSFSDGGLFAEREAALAQGEALAAEGADIVDVGGESTRPGHQPVSAEEEQARVLPVVRALAGRLRIPVSIDTYKASTARAALEAGAAVVNDVWGLQRDPEIAAVAAAHAAPVIIMHNREEADPRLDIVDEIRRFFDRSLAIARRAGIPDSDVVLDPGIGFGKSPDQHLEAIRRLPEIKALGFPVLVGISRKSLLGRISPRATQPRERLPASIAAHALAASLGADIVRVHDVAAHVEAMRVVDAVLGASPRRAIHTRPHAEVLAKGEPQSAHDRCASFEADLRSAPQDEAVEDPLPGSEKAARTDRILVERLCVYAHHGVLPEEARLGQKFVISLDCRLDLREAGRADDLAATVSYAELAALAARVATGNRFGLIEALAEAIAAEALLRFAPLKTVTVRIDKPGAPVPLPVGSVAVVITRERDG